MYFLFSGCKEDVLSTSVSYPGSQDGVYKDKNLIVKFNNKPVKVRSVTISSELIDIETYQNLEPEDPEFRPVYCSRVKISVFPSENEELTFITISDYDGFCGITSIRNSHSKHFHEIYEYRGLFIEDGKNVSNQFQLHLHLQSRP